LKRFINRNLAVALSIAACFLISCSTRVLELPGIYKVKENSLSDRLLLNRLRSGGSVVGSEITLRADSSFEYHTCGSDMSGLWSRRNDTLVLHVLKSRYQSDSMQASAGGTFKLEDISYKINRKKLYREILVEDSLKAIEVLTKTD
jgi:hypothetical protein